MACGVVRRADGRILLAQRPAGKIAAGWWEFPGGKIELAEQNGAALSRELHEELGVQVSAARPLIRIRHEYSDRVVLLDVWLVTDFIGSPQGREGQQWCWATLDEVERFRLLPTVLPILPALRLPTHYVFTPPRAQADTIRQGLARLPRGAALRLRLPGYTPEAYMALAASLLADCRAQGLQLILDRDPEAALALGAAGWHANAQAARGLSAQRLRALPAGFWVLGSAHSRADLLALRACGVHAAVLGTVRPSASHPDGHCLGWQGFSALSDRCGLPVYAIGGLGPQDLPQAWSAGAQGIAAISAYWSRSSSSDSADGSSSAAIP